MGQFMGQQFVSLSGCRCVLPTAKNNVIAYGISQSVRFAGRFRGLVIRMHPHATEVMPEPWLHECACRRVERLARRAQNFVDNWRRFHPARVSWPSGFHLYMRMIAFWVCLLAFFAGSAAVACALEARDGINRCRGCRVGCGSLRLG